MILETCVLPIEYDEKTKEKAKRIKKVLEKNPDFFRVFLKGDKISLIDENSPIYIEKGQSILKYLDGISPKYATGFLKDKYVDRPEEVLHYWVSHVYGIGIYKNKENRLRKLYGICDYFHTNEDYEGLYNYLHASEEEQQEIEEDILLWLEKTYRYHLINYLLLEQLPFLQNNLFSPFEIDMETGILDILGYRFNNFTYITDASYISDESLKLIEGTEVLVLNGLRYRQHHTHLSLQESVNIADKLGVKKAYFTHMTHDVLHRHLERELPANMHPAYDGLTIEV